MTIAGPWRKSSYSPGQNGSCVEVRLVDMTPQLSDSKLPDDRPILTVDDGSYLALLDAIKSGRF